MSHLEFYKQYGISPVNYDLSDFEAHLQRRESLYRGLGLTKLAFNNASILEVAAGTGQNSLYFSSLSPKSITLLEPNPVAIEKIKKSFEKFDNKKVSLTLIEEMLEDYQSNDKYDIVICENWLGMSDHERGLLLKLSKFVENNGALVITVVTPVGIISNLLRRALAAKLYQPDHTFEVRTMQLCNAFESHLITLPSMTRSTVDWVQDNMINPAYFDLSLSAQMVIDDLGDEFDIFGSNPILSQDWRWFKSMYGIDRKFNQHFLSEYIDNNHNFIDYRFVQDRNCCVTNNKLESVAIKLNELVRNYESKLMQNDSCQRELEVLIECITDLIALTKSMPQEVNESLLEVREILGEQYISQHSIANMNHFKFMFGRETLYLSLQKVSR